MIRLFISDFDGTLLNPAHIIDEETKEAIDTLRANGVSFMPASGRDYLMIMNEMDKIGLKPKCIALNGGAFYDNDGHMKISNPIGKKQLLEIVSMLEGYDIDVVYFADDGRNVNLDASMKQFIMNKHFAQKEFQDDIEKNNFHHLLKTIYEHTIFEPNIEKILAKTITKIDLSFHNMNLRADFWQRLSQIDGIVVTSSIGHNLEINSTYATKGHMAKKICEMYGYHEDEVVVIGDGINDLSMLMMFPCSYAMGNASEEVKKHAKHIALSNGEHGVAKVMYEVIAQNKKMKK
ncbi:MAG: Cof-type HAD-IIB family hydrolase [Erysipelotrichia bacterium]|nr:Cof-type HAD-IIB family hydrolase [Erysipelotrichia bacterium]NCC55489.1 Cof-type HAD-IIB family hydrolase [Erysipelotrichia bacterium]